MQRCLIPFLIVFILVLSVIAGINSVKADKANVVRPIQELTAYTTLPIEIAKTLSKNYEQENHTKINFIPLSPKEILQEVRVDEKLNSNVIRKADIIIADERTLKDLTNFFLPCSSSIIENIDGKFKDEQERWIGIWYDPTVFCVNKKFLNESKQIPSNWKELSETENIRVGVTDFLASDASANLLFQMIENFGDDETYEILDKIHPKVIQYAKFLSNPVRQVGMWEVDFSIAVESEALRYIQDGYPIKIIYPSGGTSYFLTGFGIMTKNVERKRSAEKFLEWLLSDEAQLSLQVNEFYFLPTNTETLASKSFSGKNIYLFEAQQNFSEQQRNKFLKQWIEEVRFK